MPGELELSNLMLFCERMDASERIGVLTCFNLVNAGALALCSLIGAGRFYSFGEDFGSYIVIMLLSTCARVWTLPLLRGAPSDSVSSIPLPLRALAVRPASGALQHPIVSGVPDLEAESGKRD
jgi:hypothetical protein